jgi:agmatinase
MENFNLQGHGIKGHYLGLKTPLESAKIVLLPIPFDRTSTYQKGASHGPAALIEASRNLEFYDAETGSEPYKRGIHTAKPIVAKQVLKRTYETTLSLLKKGKFVVGVGGEHSITPALVRAHAEFLGPFSVLQLDAHADLIPTYNGDPLNHACAMARVKEVKGAYPLVSVGIRSMSAEESPLLDLPNTFFAHDLDKEGWMDQVVEKLGQRVYITIDLDAFDSSLMPSTGTPEPGGLFWNQIIQLLKKVAEKKEIIGFDVMELCPIKGLKAPDFLAAKLIYKILSFTQ